MGSTTSLGIVLGADVRYARPLAVALGSALDHSPAGTHVTVVLDGFGPSERAALERVADRREDLEVSFLDGAVFDRGGLIADRHLTSATYLRFFLDRIVPTAARLLFLDADVLVRHSLAPLNEFDLEGKAVGAVGDMVIHDYAHCFIHPAFGDPLGAGEPYFNAGVMVVDIGRWREMEVGPRALALAREHGADDQDALNEVLRGNWARLDPTWNVQGGLLLLHEQPPHSRRDELQAQQMELLRDPAIVHFSGIKPWQPSSRHPFAREWLRTLRRCRLPGQLRWELDLVSRRAARRGLEMLGRPERRERMTPAR